MIKIKKGILMSLALIACCAPFSANASVESDNKAFEGFDKKDKEYFVCAQFNPSQKIQQGEGYDLTANKYVKQAYVRARSDGSTVPLVGIRICGSYDSGRVYSALARNKVNKIYQTPRETVKDCKTCCQRTNYGWLYF